MNKRIDLLYLVGMLILIISGFIVNIGVENNNLKMTINGILGLIMFCLLLQILPVLNDINKKLEKKNG